MAEFDNALAVRAKEDILRVVFRRSMAIRAAIRQVYDFLRDERLKINSPRARAAVNSSVNRPYHKFNGSDGRYTTNTRTPMIDMIYVYTVRHCPHARHNDSA
jgi:hypothetical protein